MNRLAIFSTPKPFLNPHFATIQRNAILSWKQLGERVEVWLVGEEEGVEQAARELGVRYIPDVARTPAGTPRIDSIFNRLRAESDAEYLCYVNADILLFPDLLATLDIAATARRRFLLVGQRWDANITVPLPVSTEWQVDFLKTFRNESKLHPPAGSDYFVFPRELFADIPPFAVGRIGWDNWMIYHARCTHMAVVDCSGSITAVHQNHDFSHLPGGKKHRRQPESLDNVKLAGGWHTMFTLANTNKRILDGRLAGTKPSRESLQRELSILPLIWLKPARFAKAVYTLLNPRRVKEQRRKEQKMQENVARTIKENS